MTLAVIVALHIESEIRSHVQISLNLGIPPEEIGEQILHLALYVGFPKAVDAMRTAATVIGERG